MSWRLRSVRSSPAYRGGRPFRDIFRGTGTVFVTRLATTGRFRSCSAPHSGTVAALSAISPRGASAQWPGYNRYFSTIRPHLCSGKWTLRYRATNFATAVRRPSGVVGSRRTRSRKSIGIRLASSARATARASRCRASRAIVARFREPFGRPAPFRKPPCFATILIS